MTIVLLIADLTQQIILYKQNLPDKKGG